MFLEISLHNVYGSSHVFIVFFGLLDVLQDVSLRLALQHSGILIEIPAATISPIFQTSMHRVDSGRDISEHILIYDLTLLFPDALPSLILQYPAYRLQSLEVGSFPRDVLVVLELGMVEGAPGVANDVDAAVESDGGHEQVLDEQLVHHSASYGVQTFLALRIEGEVSVNVHGIPIEVADSHLISFEVFTFPIDSFLPFIVEVAHCISHWSYHYLSRLE